VNFFSYKVQLIFFLGIFFSAYPLFISGASAIPTGDAYETGQAEFSALPEFHPRNDMPPILHQSLNANLNNNINEAHPIPDYIKKLSDNQPFPVYYQQLLEIDPENQIQSKVFDKEAFRLIKRIGILSFENKTTGLFKNKNAGDILAKQVSRELQSIKNYFIIPPLMEGEDAQLRIVAQLPVDKKNRAGSTNIKNQPTIPNLSHSNNEIDAVIIGAVSKYTNSYQNQNGEIKSSLGSSVEFGSFLISTRTGEVLWGARFVGSQPTGLLNARGKWLSEEQLSQTAMKKILKAFHGNSKDLN
jgi:hypothetical protein